jgi:hypothetical protein
VGIGRPPRPTFFGGRRHLFSDLDGVDNAVAPPPESIPQLAGNRAAPASNPTSAGSYEVNSSSSLTGPTLANHTITIDATKPDLDIESCARHCNHHLSCSAFDISLVYGKFTFYRSVEKSTPPGGSISGIKPGR